MCGVCVGDCAVWVEGCAKCGLEDVVECRLKMC
jgi:hypothetical protein